MNRLGHFELTGALVPLVKATEGSLVVVVSSTAPTRGVMDFDDLQFEKRGYAAWRAYGQSKLANQLFALAMQPPQGALPTSRAATTTARTASSR